MISPLITAIVIAVYTALAFGGGFMVSDWRNGAQIAKLSSQNAVLTAANGKCAEDVANVRTAMATLERATNELERKAADSMREAEPKVALRSRTITKIKELPRVAIDMQCEAMKLEQAEYVEARRVAQ